LLGIISLPRRPDLLYLAPLAVVLALWFISRMPVVHALRRLLTAEFFILGLAVLSLFSPAARPVMVSAIFKSNLCVLTMLVLTWTTPFHEILQALRQLGLPSIMLTTLALMYRYLPVLAEESRRMERARASRTFSRTRRMAWQNVTLIIGQLFVRSADRAERIYLAMRARGWK
jgi:cobalt/nickel transport system permease protein